MLGRVSFYLELKIDIGVIIWIEIKNCWGDITCLNFIVQYSLSRNYIELFNNFFSSKVKI